jgi:hypothetical protein
LDIARDGMFSSCRESPTTVPFISANCSRLLIAGRCAELFLQFSFQLRRDTRPKKSAIDPEHYSGVGRAKNGSGLR